MTQVSNSSKPAAKGGFQHGLPTVSTLPVQQSGCCGTTSQSAGAGCCGEPTSSQAVVASDIQATGGCCGTTSQAASTGCCGESTSNTALSTETQVTGGCCGEPVQGDSPASQQRCC
ncbi:hypothetical protein Krac_7366 [Ktedonobacter racemifer DSM 44963]|uniref:Uncharacterized protein n=1 Tax=Ktedonobacter racemifer DSM 44963 TaxID=485913 RepID=D6TS23_KTERA|nr:hypothetical protein Krac_7366 [Ktedonobacter racemifer DSM 44963]